MLSKFFSKKNRGFTLVELLIVVAIIGVLSTLGVPTFRRMIQKSKKSEAKVNLGGIFTAEAAFQAEYNTYGNYLPRIGFQIDGNPTQMTYRVGFLTGTGCAGSGSVAPDATSTAGAALNSAFPQYYSTAWNAEFAWAGYNATAFNNCQDVGANVAANGTAFLATAQGVVRPDVSKDTATAAQKDVWTIDNTRTLINVNDGVN